MPDSVSLSPIESNDVYRFDQLTQSYRTRWSNAMSQYLGIDISGTDFTPAPNMPGADPSPSTDPNDITPLESTRVGYYDSYTAQHIQEAINALGDFASELEDYKTYYDTQNPYYPYEIPESSVEDIDVVSDEKPPLESNVVSGYDSATKGYSNYFDTIAVGFSDENDNYDDYLNAALAEFARLEQNGDLDIQQTFTGATNTFHNKFSRNNSSVTDHNNMSVVEAATSDYTSLANSWTTMSSNVMNNSFVPVFRVGQSSQQNGELANRISQMPANVGAGLIDISEIEQDLPTP